MLYRFFDEFDSVPAGHVDCEDCQVVTNSSDHFEKERHRDWVAFVIQLTLGIYTWIEVNKDATVDLYHTFSTGPLTNDKRFFGEPRFTYVWTEFQLGYLCPLFLLLDALQYGIQLFRARFTWYWFVHGVEYYQKPQWALSAGIMTVMIGLLSGMGNIMELSQLIAGTAFYIGIDHVGNWVNVYLNQFGYKHKLKIFFWISAVQFMLVYWPILVYFFTGVSEKGAPDFVWAIQFVILGLYLLFPLAEMLKYSDIDPRLQSLIKRTLSVVSKDSLALIYFFGVRQWKK